MNNESVQSVSTNEIEEEGQSLIELEDGNENLNDTYMVTNSSRSNQNNKFKNQRVVQYPKEIINWSNFVEGHGHKPKTFLHKLQDNQKILKPVATVISESHCEKAANKPIVTAMIEGRTPKKFSWIQVANATSWTILF